MFTEGGKKKCKHLEVVFMKGKNTGAGGRVVFKKERLGEGR